MTFSRRQPRRTVRVSFTLNQDSPEEAAVTTVYESLPSGSRQEWMRRMLVIGFLWSTARLAAAMEEAPSGADVETDAAQQELLLPPVEAGPPAEARKETHESTGPAWQPPIEALF